MSQLQKINIDREADADLETMLNALNDGFTSGRVTKTQLASWIIKAFRSKYFTSQIKKIRADHFDKIAHLKAVVKQMEEAKKSNADLKLDTLLSPLTANGERSRKSKIKPTDEN